MKKKPYEIKIAVATGKGAHIFVKKEDIGKRIAIFPEHRKETFDRVLKSFEKEFEEEVNPFIKDYLSPNDFIALEKAFERLLKDCEKMKGMNVESYKRSIRAQLESLDELRVENLNEVFLLVQKRLPAKVNKRLNYQVAQIREAENI